MFSSFHFFEFILYVISIALEHSNKTKDVKEFENAKF